ncbi:MAG: acyl-ACP--UDP-N-acetylglucosamine O-acyltransferase [Chthoniobacteraceae bacterium]
MNIHPTAIIHPEAQIGAGTTIGAYVTIEGPARIGEGCTIEAKASLIGDVTIGARTTIGHSAIVGGAPQDLSFKPTTHSSVEIGADNVIRELCTIHRGTAEGSVTRMGHHNYLMAGVHLAHNVTLGNHIIIANNALLAGYVQMEDRVFVGGSSIFHQHMRIGTMAMIQGGCGLSKDVTPYTIAAEINLVFGLNAVGMRRAGFKAETRKEIQAAFKLLYRSGLNISQALEKAKEQTWGPEAQAFFDFAAASKRGLCGFAGKSGSSEEGGE